mmetsp:Transcript_100130/g.238714  ORF Transcript_100130/g.238714 Transcript_100130/m.238714 type:complete len:263 (-) Transcript_100130:1246-2034(-)
MHAGDAVLQKSRAQRRLVRFDGQTLHTGRDPVCHVGCVERVDRASRLRLLHLHLEALQDLFAPGSKGRCLPDLQQLLLRITQRRQVHCGAAEAHLPASARGSVGVAREEQKELLKSRAVEEPRRGYSRQDLHDPREVQDAPNHLLIPHAQARAPPARLLHMSGSGGAGDQQQGSRQQRLKLRSVELQMAGRRAPPQCPEVHLSQRGLGELRGLGGLGLGEPQRRTQALGPKHKALRQRPGLEAQEVGEHRIRGHLIPEGCHI